VLRHDSQKLSSALPDPASIVLRASDDRVTLVVECTAEYLISMAFEDLKTVTGLGIPQSGTLVGGCSEDARALKRIVTHAHTTSRKDCMHLRVEGHLGYLAFVAS
jgi:hypothetical protein